MNIYVFKLIIFTCISVPVIATNDEGTLINQAFHIVGQCTREHHLDIKEMEKVIRKLELPSSEDGKCFISCILEGFGLISDDEINLEKSYEFNKMQFHDPNDLMKANEISAACKDDLSTSTDKGCDFAIVAANCILKKTKDVGFRYFHFKT